MLREVLLLLLEQWEAGILSVQDVHITAEELFVTQWDDVPKNCSDSIPLEVLSHLEVLNRQLITPEDIPAMRRFILEMETPAQAWSAWIGYMEGVDWEKRKRSMATDSYYLT